MKNVSFGFKPTLDNGKAEVDNVEWHLYNGNIQIPYISYPWSSDNGNDVSFRLIAKRKLTKYFVHSS